MLEFMSASFISTGRADCPIHWRAASASVLSQRWAMGHCVRLFRACFSSPMVWTH